MVKYINLNAQDRYVPTPLLRGAYLHYEESLNLSAPNFVELGEGLELGIVSSQVPDIAKAVSSILSRSLEDAKYTKGGYLPAEVVERVQLNIISPNGISDLWGITGHRFILSRNKGQGISEIIGSILVSRSRDSIFFFTGRYNNLRHSTIRETVDLEQPLADNPDQKWFDQFAFPPLEIFKPKGYHQIANFVINKEDRGTGLGRFFLDNIVKYYSRDYITTNKLPIEHSQHLLCGFGFWQIGDPPWLRKMQQMGFYLRAGAESFFVEQDWCPLPPIYQEGKLIDNVSYNASFGLPALYENWVTNGSPNHLVERIPEVSALALNPKAKLQYFQAMFDFV
jgi:hypothetical protein